MSEQPSMQPPLNEEMTYRLLQTLERDPYISQRKLAKHLGVSLGKANYCLRALVDKGLVKAGNFQSSNNKKAYVYLLTPKGIEAKTKATVHFLKTKMREYDALKDEIERLKHEVFRQSAGTDSE